MKRDLLVVLLAGGGGSRIGGDKPNRKLGGRRLLDHAIALAGRYGGTMVLSKRPGLDLGHCDIPHLIDAPGIEGPLGGLAAAFGLAAHSGALRILLIPVDMPFLPGNLAERLSLALDREPGAGAAIAVSEGREYPVCSLWRAGAAPLLDTYIQSGERSLKGLARHVSHVTVEWPDGPFFNINSAEDLAEAERRMAT